MKAGLMPRMREKASVIIIIRIISSLVCFFFRRRGWRGRGTYVPYDTWHLRLLPANEKSVSVQVWVEVKVEPKPKPGTFSWRGRGEVSALRNTRIKCRKTEGKTYSEQWRAITANQERETRISIIIVVALRLWGTTSIKRQEASECLEVNENWEPMKWSPTRGGFGGKLNLGPNNETTRIRGKLTVVRSAWAQVWSPI